MERGPSKDASSDNDCRKVRLRGIGPKPPNAQPVENTAAGESIQYCLVLHLT